MKKAAEIVTLCVFDKFLLLRKFAKFYFHEMFLAK